MFVVALTLEVFPHDWENVLPLLMGHAPAARQEAACRRLDTATGPGRAGAIPFWNIHDDEAGVEAHGRTPNFARFVAAAKDMVRRKSLATFAQFEE